MCPKAVRVKYTPLRGPLGRPKAKRDAFSTLEYAVIRMVIHGVENKQIAFQLAISKRYLIGLFCGIYRKVGLRKGGVAKILLLYWTLSDSRFENEWISVGVNPSWGRETAGTRDAPRP